MKGTAVRAVVCLSTGIAALAGCEKPMTDTEQDAEICDGAFLRDKSWDNLPAGSPMAQKLEQEMLG